MANTRRPGAYIKEGPSNVPATIADSIKNVGIVGSGSPYYAVNNIEIIRGEGLVDEIPGLTNTDLVYNLQVQGGYRAGIDFFNYGGNTIGWAEGDEANVPGVGSAYYINYDALKTDEYYLPQECYDIEEVINVAGPLVLED